MDTVLGWNEASQERRSCRRANWIATQRSREPNPLARKLIDVRRSNIRIAIATQRPCALIVRQDEDQIRSL